MTPFLWMGEEAVCCLPLSSQKELNGKNLKKLNGN